MSGLKEKVAAALATEPVVLSPSSPYKSAEKFLQRRYTGADGLCRLISYRDSFYEWTGTHYREMDREDLRAEVWKFLQAARVMIQAKEDETPTTGPFNPNTTKVNVVTDAARSQVIIKAHVDAPAWRPGSLGECLYPAGEMLACQNGLLHLPTQTMIPRTPELLSFNALDFDFDPAAPAPVEWVKFLHSMWPNDPESIATLQEIFGYHVSNDLSQQKLFMLIGPKRAGKGTIARVLRRVLGECNVAGPTLRSLSENFGLEPLIGKRAAIIADARIGGGSDQSIVVERLLSISGEDALTVHRKYKSAWNGKLGARVLLLSNELPRFTDTSATIASRFIILKFTESFYDREDRGIERRVMCELPGILRWSLDGLTRLNRRGHFIMPASAKAEVERMEELSSPILAFVRDRCELGSTFSVPINDLFGAWETWCHARGLPAGSSISFSNALHSAVPSVRRERPRVEGDRVRVFAGIGLAAAGGEVVHDRST
jgi:putative DNA primase/helicase